MDTTKEKRYEDLVNAVAGGELKMVKFLWGLVSEITDLVAKTPQSIIEKRSREVDALLKNIKDNPAKDGKTPTKDELLSLIKPLIPPAIPGKPGKTPTQEEILELINLVMPDPIPGPPGIGIPGKPGKNGRIPNHKWTGTFIQFENPDGSWGPMVNLQGSPAESIEYGGPGPSMPSVTVVQGSTRFEGVTKIVIGDNLTAVRTPNGVVISGENGGGGGGSSLDFETPTGTIDDSNLTFDVLNTPIYLVVNGAQYFEGVHYTLAGLTITLNNPIGTGGFIRSAFGSGLTVETPTGTVDDSNTSFTVSNTPKYIVVNGAQYFDGAGYTYLAGTITLDNPVGTGGFIRSIY